VEAVPAGHTGKEQVMPRSRRLQERLGGCSCLGDQMTEVTQLLNATDRAETLCGEPHCNTGWERIGANSDIEAESVMGDANPFIRWRYCSGRSRKHRGTASLRG
jgi:hypothetical protein